MYYPQSTKDIRLVIMSFDDVMFDLTHLRYNYYRRLCRLYNTQLNREEFIRNIGSSRIMFKDSPIDHALLTTEALIDKIETDLYSYCRMYGLKSKDGLSELMELLKQRQIPCVAFSSHELKYAQSLMNLAMLYNKPQVLIGDHPDIAPLPDGELFDIIMQQYQVKPENTLVIASSRNACLAANQLKTNFVFIPDLQKENKELTIRSLKVCHSLLDVLNLLLESRLSVPSREYMLVESDDPNDIYSHYQHLVNTYRQDPETVQIINQIYQDEYARAQKDFVEKTVDQQEVVQPDPAEMDSLEELENQVAQSLHLAVDKMPQPEVEQKAQMAPEPEIDDVKEMAPIELKAQEVHPEDDLTDIEKEERPSDDPIDQVLAQLKPVSEKAKPALNPIEEMANEPSEMLDIDQLKKPEPDAPTATAEYTDTFGRDLQNMIDDIESASPKQEKTEKKPDFDKTKTMMFTKEELKFLGFKEDDLLSDDESIDEYIEKNEHHAKFKVSSIFLNFFYALFTSLIVVGIVGIVCIALGEWMNSGNAIGSVLQTVIGSIDRFALTVFSWPASQIGSLFGATDLLIEAICNVMLMTIILWILYVLKDVIQFQLKRRHR